MKGQITPAQQNWRGCCNYRICWTATTIISSGRFYMSADVRMKLHLGTTKLFWCRIFIFVFSSPLEYLCNWISYMDEAWLYLLAPHRRQASHPGFIHRNWNLQDPCFIWWEDQDIAATSELKSPFQPHTRGQLPSIWCISVTHFKLPEVLLCLVVQIIVSLCNTNWLTY